MHSRYVINQLIMRKIEGWSVKPIQNMSEVQVGEALRASKIFLSFSELEGLPLPPLEAAICGNSVIGYTGEGAKEYWDPAIFKEIHSGNLQLFLKAIVDEINNLGSKKKGILQDPKAESIINNLRDRYSTEAELNNVKCLLQKSESAFS